VLQKTNNSFTDPALFHAPDASDAVASPARLATLTRTGLLDSTPQDVFDRLTRAAAHAVLAPIAIVSLVDETRLVFAGAHGLPEPWASVHQAPLTHSLTDRVVEANAPVVINDVRDASRLTRNKSLQPLGIVAYAGMPLTTSTGQVLGAFCAIDHQPREWTDEELGRLRDFAALALREIEWRLEATDRAPVERSTSHAEEEFRNLAESMSAAILITDGSRFRYVNSAMERVTGYSRSELLAMDVTGIVHAEFRALIQSRIRARQRGERLSSSFEVKIVTKDGREGWANVSVATLQFEGRPLIVASAFDVTERKSVEEQLEHSRIQLRSLLRRLEEVREEERRRISREIHDELGQTLTGLKFELSWLARHAPVDPAKHAAVVAEKARSMIKQVDATMLTVRALAADLRPAVLDELGLLPAIEWQLEILRSRTGIAWRFASNVEEIHLETKHVVILFRILQEALTNIARHAEATTVDVSVREENGTLSLEVIDNGRGIQPQELADPYSLGLVGMRERALQIGGIVTVAPGAKRGTTVSVEVPLHRASLQANQPFVERRLNPR